jgi:hypothetical protein
MKPELATRSLVAEFRVERKYGNPPEDSMEFNPSTIFSLLIIIVSGALAQSRTGFSAACRVPRVNPKLVMPNNI